MKRSAFVLLIAGILFSITAEGHIHTPGDMHLLKVGWSDTLGNKFGGAVSCSATVWIGNSKVAWKVVPLARITAGIYAAMTIADSAGFVGDYYAAIVAYTVQERTPLAIDDWQIVEWPDEINTIVVRADTIERRIGTPIRTIAGDIEDLGCGPNEGVLCTVNLTYDGGTPLDGALVGIRQMTGAAVLASGTTDAGGTFAFWRKLPTTIPPGDSLLVFMSHPFVTFTVPETLVVQAVDVDSTWEGIDHTPDIAPDPDLKHVYAYLKWPGSAAGTMLPRAGIIVGAELVRGTAPYVPSSTLSRYVFADTTDVNGRWDLWVVPNDDITPLGTRYKFVIGDIPEIIKIVIVPDAPGSVDFNDL